MEVVIELWKAGVPVREIVERTGLTKYKVWQAIGQTKGPKSRHKPEKHPKAERVIYLFNWNYKPHEIAEGEGMKLKTVQRIIECHGI
jgi:hypothetical protein